MAVVASPRLCCIPSCTAAPDPRCCDRETPLCAEHFEHVSENARARSAQTRRRLEWLTAHWHDNAYFDAVEKSGRYLKFATAMAQAIDAAHLAWQRVRIEAAVAALLAIANEHKPAPTPHGRRGNAA
jgi:hypothetical protein